MSESGITTVLERIRFASVDSPIAVYFIPGSTGYKKFDSVFADSTATIRRVRYGNPNLIGIFNKSHIDSVKPIIEDWMEKNEVNV